MSCLFIRIQVLVDQKSSGNYDGSGLEPRATRGRHKSCGALQDVIPPSIRLDEPTTLNKERVGQSSEARECGNQSASGESSWEP